LHILPYAGLNLLFAALLAHFGAKFNFYGFRKDFKKFMELDKSNVDQQTYQRYLLCALFYTACYFTYFATALLLLLSLRTTVAG